MKVTCEYCGSYVEADENMKCPLCDGALGPAVQAQQARAEEQEEEARQREAEEKAQEAKEGHVSEIITGIASVATAIASGVARANTNNKPQPPHAGDDAPPISHVGGHRPPEPPDGSHMPPRQHGGQRRMDPGAFRPSRPR